MPMPSNSYDVVIAGGAIIGSAIAYFLAKQSEGRLRVAVVERDPTYEFSSTALSLASIRTQFSTPLNIAVSQFGVAFLRHGPEELAVDGDMPDFGFTERGYLLLAGADGVDVLRRNNEVQQASGAEVAVLSADEIRERFAWMETGDIAGGALGLRDEGWFDAYALMQAFRRKAASLGVDYVTDVVADLDVSGGRIAAVNLEKEGRVGAGWVVNATGPRAARFAAKAGVDLPVVPRKRTVFVFDAPVDLPGCPLIVDPSGVYVRPEGTGFICGSSPLPADPDPDVDVDDFAPDWDKFESFVWPRLAARIPALERLRLRTAWAGHYAVNPHDHNAILGAHPVIGNLVFANGFSGHGVQQAPAVGRGIAELIVDGEYRSLDLSPFGYDRFEAGRLIRELNVI